MIRGSTEHAKATWIVWLIMAAPGAYLYASFNPSLGIAYFCMMILWLAIAVTIQVVIK